MYVMYGGKIKPQKLYYNYSMKMFTRKAKQIQIIDSPDNQHPDKWSCTVFCALCSTEMWNKNLLEENTILRLGTKYQFVAKEFMHKIC
jgi:hypothetical protein